MDVITMAEQRKVDRKRDELIGELIAMGYNRREAEHEAQLILDLEGDR